MTQQKKHEHKTAVLVAVVGGIAAIAVSAIAIIPPLLREKPTSSTTPTIHQESHQVTDGVYAAGVSAGRDVRIEVNTERSNGSQLPSVADCDTEIASRLAVFEHAIQNGQATNWKKSPSYQNVLWFLDNPSERFPHLRDYRFVALVQALQDRVPESEKGQLAKALKASQALERHRESVKNQDPNQSQNPPPEISEMLDEILPALKLQRWTALAAYRDQ